MQLHLCYDSTKPRPRSRRRWLLDAVGLACAAAVLALVSPAFAEDQYLAGDWNGDHVSNLAVRRSSCVLKDTNLDEIHDSTQCYGYGNEEQQYLVGDWDGDGTDNLAVRRENCVYMDTNADGLGDITQCYGLGRGEDEYLVGDWDGDGRDNLAVRRGNCVLMDTNFDGVTDITQCYGFGNAEDEYLVGDWDGDGRDNLAVRRGSCVFMDTNFDGLGDLTQCYGRGSLDDQYLVGDWDGDGRDNLAVRRNNCVFKDTNFDGLGDATQCYGDGSPSNSLPGGSTLPQCGLSLVGPALPLVVPSSGLIDIFSHVRGNNDMPRPVSIGVQDYVADGYVFTLEDDATITSTQASIVLRNGTTTPKIAIGIASGRCTQPTNLSVAAGAVGQMTLSTADATTLILRRLYCGLVCFSRIPQDVVVFDENKFWSALGGKKLTIDWFHD